METHNKSLVSFDSELLVLVNEQDQEVGYLDKKSCHQDQGILHRAFSIFIFNEEGKLLLQKRSQLKPLWPLYWANSCCSHPRKGESLEIATKRRLKEEVGIQASLEFAFKFSYFAKYKNLGVEKELCHVFLGKCTGPIVVNSTEIAETQFIDPDDLTDQIRKHPEQFTPWLKIEWNSLMKHYSNKLNKYCSFDLLKSP